MKRFITALTVMLILAVTASAMSYEQARDQALFLTDKMAYELNLTEEQYDAAFEINLDYLMSVNTPDDLYAAYWTQRNLDLSYILLDWQYRAFCAATYFYRPLYFASGAWHFAIYSRYPRRHFLYFGRPNIYITYRGGHSWHHNGGRSWYKGRTFHHGHSVKGHGLRDRFDRGDFHHKGSRPGGGHGIGRPDNRRYDKHKPNNGNRYSLGATQRPKGWTVDKSRVGQTFRNNRSNMRNHRESSTRTTARPNKSNGSSIGRRQVNVSRKRTPSNTFSPNRSVARPSTVNRNTPKRSIGSGGRSHGASRNGATRGGRGNFGGKN